MAKLTEEMVHARTRQSNLSTVSKLNCWGSELQDVSLVRKLPNVEVLSLSVNRIRTLSDFQHCKKLQHLFVRKNDIRDLNQVCYLQDLPALKSLWLAENPCAGGSGYRQAVLRALPNLEKLDDLPVTTDEVQEAQRHGFHLHHPDAEDSFNQLPENDVEALAPGFPEEQDTDEHFASRSNHYSQNDFAQHYQRNSCSPELSPGHSNYTRTSGHSYHQDETHQNNGYEAVSYDHNEDDYRSQSYNSTVASAIQIPNHHRAANKSQEAMPDDDSSPRSLKQEEDHEGLHPRATLTRSRTESLPRLSRFDAYDSEDYTRSGLSSSRCCAYSQPRSVRPDLDDCEGSSSRTVLTRSRTVDMLGSHHAGSLSSLHERERPRQKQCDGYVPRPLQQPASRPRNINVLNAVLCLIKELELQDLELVALNVNCRIDELRV